MEGRKLERKRKGKKEEMPESTVGRRMEEGGWIEGRRDGMGGLNQPGIVGGVGSTRERLNGRH